MSGQIDCHREKQCQCNVNAMSMQCQCNVNTMSMQCQCNVNAMSIQYRRRLRLGVAVEGILQNEDGAELEGLLKDMKLAAGVRQGRLLKLPDEGKFVGGRVVGGGGQLQLGRGEEGGGGVGARLGVVVLVVVGPQHVHLAVQLLLGARGGRGQGCKGRIGKSWGGGAECCGEV